jgi:thiamine biosynthesis lipoprotein
MSNRLAFKKNILPFAICYLLLAICCGCQPHPLNRESRLMMGTIVEVVSPDKRATRIAFDEIERIEGLLSKYKPDSEVSRLNRAGQLTVSPPTLYVLRQAKRFWAATEGAFDITVGPLMTAWGFSDKNFRLPDKQSIAQALESVGFDKVVIDEQNSRISFSREGMSVDLGAIAKGYAVDCAVEKLKQAGIKSCLISAGGDIYCLGDKAGKPWNIAIANPRGQGSLGNLQLKGRAVATSGGYQQYFFKQGKRYSHIFNPQTGYPADSGVVSATVIAPDCLTADALATSIFVLGKQQGIRLAKKFEGVEVKIFEEKDVSYNQ